MINKDEQEKNKSEGDWDELFATSLTDQLEVEEMESNNIIQFFSMTPNKEFKTKYKKNKDVKRKQKMNRNRGPGIKFKEQIKAKNIETEVDRCRKS